MEEVKRMDIQAFMDFGFLQEANRMFFHPLGLALEVNVNEKGEYTLGGVWNYMDDPEGMFFHTDTIDVSKAARVEELWKSKAEARIKMEGSVIQPIEPIVPEVNYSTNSLDPMAPQDFKVELPNE